MALALFDLDQTLIAGDSDYLWGEFLVEKGLVDKYTYQQTNKKFFDDYKNGTLNMEKYLEFCLYPLSQHTMDNLLKLREEFVNNKIKPQIYPSAIRTINNHKDKNHNLLIISATNEFIVSGVVRLFGINNFLATNVEIINGKYTGKSKGEPCFKDGKVINLNKWLQNNKLNLDDSYFYSDSFNDLPLLKAVKNPIAVNSDNKLREYALQNNWHIEDWKL